MKILINTDILIDAAGASERHEESKKFLNDLIASPEFSLWVSALSVINVNNVLSKLHNPNKAKDWFKFIQERFSVIPIRKSILAEAAEENNTDFEEAIQAASSRTLKMDCMVTRHQDRFMKSDIPVFSPAEFMVKWKAGEFNSVSKVPFMDLGAQHHQVYNEIDDRITEIISTSGFILGKHVDEFEKGFAELQEAKYCIGVSTGTDALHVALMVLGVGPGDAVVVPVNTFIATAEAVSLTGAVPIFVDCDEYYNMDVSQLMEVLEHRPKKSGSREKKIKAIIPVHLYGQPANMDEIVALADEFGLAVVEDCCQAHLALLHGKKVGNFGSFGAFSFYPGKNLGAYGEAGALNTNDENLYLKAKMIRQHGEIERYHHNVVGHNYRMEAFQGAVLATKLKYLDEWTKKRNLNARLYNELLGEVEGIQVPKELNGTSCVYHLYVIQSEDRDGLQKYLGQHGIATGLHYPVPLHLQVAYKDLGYKKGDFPVAEKASRRILSLPMFPELSKGQIHYVCEKIQEYVKGLR